MVELTNCLAEQPQWIVDRAADRHLGLTFKYKTFPPSVGEVLDYVASLLDMRERYDRYDSIQSRKGPIATESKPFRPYPKLWEAFAGEPDVIKALDAAESFDFLTEASKRLAIRGKDAARKFIYPQPVDTCVTDQAA